MVSTPDGLFASDNWYANVDTDTGTPEMAIGRLPVLTPQELSDVIDKIIAYERYAGNRVIMLADDPDSGGDFTAVSNVVASLVPSDYSVEKIYLSEHSVDNAQQMLLDGMNSGAFLLNYIGHAGLDRLTSEGVFKSSDLDSLVSGGGLSVMTAMTCVVGQFSVPGFDFLSEELILKPDAGAVAVWAPTGLSLNKKAKVLDETFFRAVFEDGDKVLGDAILKSLEVYDKEESDTYMLDIYNLLGDPALQLH
jgi:hypothetical protein